MLRFIWSMGSLMGSLRSRRFVRMGARLRDRRGQLRCVSVRVSPVAAIARAYGFVLGRNGAFLSTAATNGSAVRWGVGLLTAGDRHRNWTGLRDRRGHPRLEALPRNPEGCLIELREIT